MRDAKQILPRAVFYPRYGWSTHLWKPVLATTVLAVVADAIANPGMLCTFVAWMALCLGLALSASVVEDDRLGSGPILQVLRTRALGWVASWLVRLASVAAFAAALWLVDRPADWQTVIYASAATGALLLLALVRALTQGSSKKKQADTTPLHSA